MNIFADRYQFRARIIPEFLTVFPLVIFIISFTSNILVLGFLSIALFFIFFQGHFSSRQGRKLERKLLENGKLKRNVVLIEELSQSERCQEIADLIELASQKATIANPLSTSEEKDKNVKLLVDWLIEHTRDREKFPAVFDKLCDYGFYRNMLAMKWIAFMSLALAIKLPLLPNVAVDLESSPHFYTVVSKFAEGGLIIPSIWVFFVIVWVMYWTMAISVRALQQASQDYLLTLLKAVHSVESEPRTTSQEISL